MASARACLRLNPINHEARMLLIQSLIKGGELSEAKDEFRTLMELEPPNREAMEAWFEKNVPPEQR